MGSIKKIMKGNNINISNDNVAQLPLVSICSITYNHAPYIRQCLDGFLMQKTNFKYEIIIHDDASTDGTAEIIKEYAERYRDLITPVFQTENQYSKGLRGFFANFVFPHAKGKYIALCEGDDFWIDPYKLQKQVDFLENNPVYSVIGHNAIKLNEENKKCTLLNQSFLKNEYTIEDIIINYWFIPTGSIFFRKSTLQDREYNKNFTSGDYYLQLRLLLGGEKLYYSNEVMSVYRIHPGGISQNFTTEILVNNLSDLYAHINEVTNFIYNDSIEQKKEKLKKRLQEELKLKKIKKSFKYKLIVAASNFFHHLLKI